MVPTREEVGGRACSATHRSVNPLQGLTSLLITGFVGATARGRGPASFSLVDPVRRAALLLTSLPDYQFCRALIVMEETQPASAGWVTPCAVCAKPLPAPNNQLGPLLLVEIEGVWRAPARQTPCVEPASWFSALLNHQLCRIPS